MRNLYFSRYAHDIELFFNVPVSRNLGIVVTIPCFNETDLIRSLNSLQSCDMPGCDTEVIVLINQPENSDIQITQVNQACIKEAKQWIQANPKPGIQYLISEIQMLPEKLAGVGYARKIAMDEAARRLQKANNPDGIICGFDADATCQKNFLVSLERTFHANSRLNGVSVFFEHPVELDDRRNSIGIMAYELHLRYYVQALRYVHYPYAFHTVGSSMAVRSNAYQKQGGMNKRKAGEDFYFLNKIMQLGDYGEITETSIYPSARISSRVPFGTGRAMSTWANSNESEFLTYSPVIFKDLGVVINKLNSLYKADKNRRHELYLQLPASFKYFMEYEAWEKNISACQLETASRSSYFKRMYHWLDSLKILRYIHHARDKFYPNVKIDEALSWLFSELKIPFSIDGNLKKMLYSLREYEKNHPAYLNGSDQVK